MSLIGIDRRLRNIRRIRQILGVFAKYGFRDIIDRLPAANRLIPHKIRTAFSNHSRAERTTPYSTGLVCLPRFAKCFALRKARSHCGHKLTSVESKVRSIKGGIFFIKMCKKNVDIRAEWIQNRERNCEEYFYPIF